MFNATGQNRPCRRDHHGFLSLNGYALIAIVFFPGYDRSTSDIGITAWNHHSFSAYVALGSLTEVLSHCPRSLHASRLGHPWPDRQIHSNPPPPQAECIWTLALYICIQITGKPKKPPQDKKRWHKRNMHFTSSFLLLPPVNEDFMKCDKDSKWVTAKLSQNCWLSAAVVDSFFEVVEGKAKQQQQKVYFPSWKARQSRSLADKLLHAREGHPYERPRPGWKMSKKMVETSWKGRASSDMRTSTNDLPVICTMWEWFSFFFFLKEHLTLVKSAVNV